MAQIKSISFNHVGRNEGCCCDKCGQYIVNVWHIEYANGEQYNLGIDCFSKLSKSSNLSAFGAQQFKKLLKRIKEHQEMFEAEKALTEETDICYQNMQVVPAWERSEPYWRGKPWEEYHRYMIEEWWACRFAEDEKELAKFSKVRF